jgi:hypothetical protein
MITWVANYFVNDFNGLLVLYLYVILVRIKLQISIVFLVRIY